MAHKPLTKIKHGEKVLNALQTSTFFLDISRATSLESKALQKVLAALQKNGYIVKDHRDHWTIVEGIDEKVSTTVQTGTNNVSHSSDSVDSDSGADHGPRLDAISA
jgi:hypothetical protein